VPAVQHVVLAVLALAVSIAAELGLQPEQYLLLLGRGYLLHWQPPAHHLQEGPQVHQLEAEGMSGTFESPKPYLLKVQ